LIRHVALPEKGELVPAVNRPQALKAIRVFLVTVVVSLMAGHPVAGRLFKYSQPIRRCRQPSRPISICRLFEG
jgi:hypothetical protein